MESGPAGDWAAPSSVAARADVERHGTRDRGENQVQHPGCLDSAVQTAGHWLDGLEGSLDIFVGVGQGDGSAVGAGGGMFGSCELGPSVAGVELFAHISASWRRSWRSDR